MLRHYVRLALKVLLRRKFFTFVSLFGTAFTLVVLTVVAAIADHVFAPAAPESRQPLTVEVTHALMYGPHSTWSSAPGFKMLDRYARQLPGADRVSLSTHASTAFSFVGGQKIAVEVKKTDAEFWQIFDFTFLDGRPYTADEFAGASMVAVISRDARRRLLGDAPAIGAPIDVDGQRFRVVGVVEDVSGLRTFPHADVWVPFSTNKTPAYRDEFIGDFQAIALARRPEDIPQIQSEFNARLRRAELPGAPGEFERVIAPLESKLEGFARSLPFLGNRRSEDSHVGALYVWAGGFALLFSLLPAVNLVNLNVSRILERASEIGVRKAFGASSRTLVIQFIVENIMLTMAGAALAFVAAGVVLRAINQSGVIPHAALALNLRVFAWGVALALVFGLISGVYPAWRMSRLRPVDALKGAAR